MATVAELVVKALEAGSDIIGIKGIEGPSLVYDMMAEAGDGIMGTAEEVIGNTVCEDEMVVDDTAVVDAVLSGSTK